MDYYPREKAEAEFLAMTDDTKSSRWTLYPQPPGPKCKDKWMASQEVYCQLLTGHTGMHWSPAESDANEDCELWWGGFEHDRH